MVQILPPNPQGSFKRSLVESLGSSLPKSLEGLLDNYIEKQNLARENRALGIPEDVRDPRIRDMLLSEGIRQQRASGLTNLGNKSLDDFSNEDIIQLSQIDPKTASMIWNMKKERLKTTAEKPSDFEKTYGKKSAERTIKLEEKLPEIKSQISNIEELEKLTSSLMGPIGTIKAVLGTENASKFNSLAASTLKPIFEIFNPRGAIPQAKIEWAQRNFQPSAKELTTTIRGKTEALKLLANQAYQNAKNEIQILKKYKGQIPEELQNELDKDLEEQFDQLTGFDKLPEQEKSKLLGNKEEKNTSTTEVGHIKVNKKTGERRQWNGEAWVQI